MQFLFWIEYGGQDDWDIIKMRVNIIDTCKETVDCQKNAGYSSCYNQEGGDFFMGLLSGIYPSSIIHFILCVSINLIIEISEQFSNLFNLIIPKFTIILKLGN